MNFLKTICKPLWKRIERKNYSREFYYKDQISELLLTQKRNCDLRSQIEAMPNSNCLFAEAICYYGEAYEKEFSSKLYYMFYNIDIAKKKLSLENATAKQVLFGVRSQVTNSYEAFKEYLTELVHFYLKHPGFEYPLGCYPQRMLSEPFFDYLNADIQLERYDSDVKTFQYLTLIEKIIFARFLGLSDDNISRISNELSKFTKSSNHEISKISKRIRDKLYKYKGVKCPYHLIYISLLSDKEAMRIAEFILNRYFEKETSLEALKLAFLGRLGIIPEDAIEAKICDNNPFYSKPLIIKNKKRGYVAYMYEYLERNGYIFNDNKWNSISNHKYFKSRKSDGKDHFIKPNEFSQSLGYKIKRLYSTGNKTKDKELDELHLFLCENFKERN